MAAEISDPEYGKVWSVNGERDSNEDLHYRARSKGTIIVCSVVLLALTAVLAAWIILTRPHFSPNVRIVARSAENSESLVKEVQTLKDFPSKDLRLPRTIIPTDYHIKLNLDLSKDDFSGQVLMNLRTERNTKYIIFHARDLEITDVGVASELDDKELKIKQILSYNPYEMVSIELVNELKEWKRYTLEIKYTTKFNTHLSGLYKSSYRTRLGKFTTVATSHFEPTDARSVFPCFDEPSFKAKFHVKMVHDKNFSALTNMPVDDSRDLGIGLVEDTFKTSVVMSTYLVAFAVVDFKYKETVTKSGIRVRVYAPENDYDRIDYPLEVGAKVVSYYEDFFGTPYPLPKLDLLAVPDFLAGAMEDWGIVSFRSSYLIYDKNLTTTDQKKQITLVIAHELAHQWFGNLVTMKWWNDIWLNEGFANFVEMLGTNQVNDKFHMLDLQVPNGWQSAITLDSLKNSHPIDQPVKFPSEIDELFDAISYNKGAAVLRMLHSFLSQDFIKGVKTYIQSHQFGNAETDDLWKNLEDAHGNLSIKPVMDTWTKQKGFPVITLERDGEYLKVKQKSFYLEKDSKIGKGSKKDVVIPESFLWHVPFTYIYDKDPEQINMVWLHKVPQIRIPAPKNFKWVKANAQVQGYYVVNYDTKTWKNLIDQLLSDHKVISPVDRAGLIHDSFKLACDGILDPMIPLELSRYLKNEKDYLPWAMVRAKVDCMSMLMSNKTVKKLYKKYFWKIQSHLVNATMLEPSKYHMKEPLDRFQRVESFAYALKYNLDKSFKRKLRKLFRKLKNEESISNMPAELRALTLMFGFNPKDEGDFEFLWKLYVNTELDSDRRILMKAFSRFKTKKKLASVLNNSLDMKKVRMQDSIPLLITIVKVGGRKQVWDFIISHFKDFQERYGHGYQLGSLLSEVAGGFYKKKEHKQVKDFLSKHSIGKKGSMTEKQILEKIENNMQKHGSGTKKGSGKTIEKWVLREMGVSKDSKPDVVIVKDRKKLRKNKKTNKS